MYTVDHFDTEGRCFYCFWCTFWQNGMRQLGEKKQFPGFLFRLFPEVVKKCYLGEVGDKATFDCLLSWWHLCANYQNRLMFDKLTSRQSSDIFSETYVKRRILLLGYMGELCNKRSAVAEMGDRLAIIDIDRKLVGAAEPLFWGRELGPHLTQCRLERGLRLYQV